MIRRALIALVVPLLLAAGLQASAEDILYTPVEDDDVIVVLVIGSDAGPPRGGTPRDGRADGFHLVAVSPDRQHASILNFPRDSWVPVAGMGTTKINACLMGGPERCVATVENLFGTQVDAWVTTSMLAMAKAFREYGGVRVEVEHALSDGGPPITQGGEQNLKREALTFARNRKERSGGDFRRSEAQGELMVAAHRKLVRQRSTVDGIMDALAIFRSHTLTDASPAQLLRYAFTASDIPPKNVHNVNVPGNVGTAGAASVVRLPDRAFALVRDVLADGRPPEG